MKKDPFYDVSYTQPVEIKQGPFKLRITETKYSPEMPKPISAANLDGTMYVVFDRNIVGFDKWVIAKYNLNHWEAVYNTDIQDLNPTHFVHYYGV